MAGKATPSAEPADGADGTARQREPRPANAATTAATTDPNAPWPAINLRACGLTLRHPPSYLVTSNRISKDPLSEVQLLENLPGTRVQLAGKGPPGEAPLQLHFASYRVPDDTDAIRWLRTRPGPKVSTRAIRRATVAGLPALFYHSTGGEAQVDGVVWSCPGHIVEARAPFYTPDEAMRAEFARILTMVQVHGAPVQSPATCTPPGLPCPSPQLSLCVPDPAATPAGQTGQWACRSLDPGP